MNYQKKITAYLTRLKATIDTLSIADVDQLMNVLHKARLQERNIFIMGNGGSSATASHFVCDFTKGLNKTNNLSFKFICLNDNIPTMMAYANDVSWDEVFINPLKNYFQESDLVIGISGSGNSVNVIKAIEWANLNGGITIGLTGYDGGKLIKICKHNINIPVNDMQITEDLHLILNHCMMSVFLDQQFN